MSVTTNSQKYIYSLTREKNLQYYYYLLHQEKFIVINTISDKANSSKIIYHSVYLINIIPEEKWGPSPNSTRTMPTFPIPYSYHDYITAWSRFMLHKNENMSHSWFVNFDKSFTGYLPLWFNRWYSLIKVSLALLMTYFLNHYLMLFNVSRNFIRLMLMVLNSLLCFPLLSAIKYLGY